MTLSFPIVLESFDLHAAERLLCERALQEAGSIVEAARLLGITRHSLKRRIIKLRISWPARQADHLPAELRPHSS
ncbi:helix-turn-helix domain-containing protein [Nannocystis pusilla]|uniref:helix-turn-helix domain-containing protein n=1 Tax=Nannocystis pusilla TaxID=889268 RepID=UPI003B7A95D3